MKIAPWLVTCLLAVMLFASGCASGPFGGCQSCGSGGCSTCGR